MDQLGVLLGTLLNLAALHRAPSVRPDLVAVHVRENVGLVSAPVDVELVEVAHEGVVCAGLRRILGVQIHPLALDCLEFSQVVEVDAALARVAPEEEDAVFEGEAVGAGAGSRLVVVARRVEPADLLPLVADFILPVSRGERHLQGSNE